MGRSRSHILLYCQRIREKLLNTDWLSSSHVMVSGGFAVFRWGPAYFLAPHLPAPLKKTSDPAQPTECVCLCVFKQRLCPSTKGKLSVLCFIQKCRKFLQTQERCNLGALSQWALEKEVDNHMNSAVWYEQTFQKDNHIYTPINTHV